MTSDRRTCSFAAVWWQSGCQSVRMLNFSDINYCSSSASPAEKALRIISNKQTKSTLYKLTLSPSAMVYVKTERRLTESVLQSVRRSNDWPQLLGVSCQDQLTLLWVEQTCGTKGASGPERSKNNDSLTVLVEILTCVTPTETNLQPAKLKVYKSAMQTSHSHQQDLLNCRNWQIYKPKSLCSTFLAFLVLSLTFWTAPAERLWPSPLYYHSETQLSINRGIVVFLLWHLL